MELTFWATIGVILTVLFVTWQARGYVNGKLSSLDSIAKDIKDIRERSFSLIENLANRQAGLLDDIIKIVPVSKTNPLTPEKAQRRNELMTKGRAFGLDQAEANELEALLREEAYERFTAGGAALLGFLALAALVIALFSSKGEKS
ncbi:MAG: hypothetical protein HWN68_18675 [Desulfobacterales bacterium]|nr:hypothetical protein [Desulfobacterales bacterium]